MPVFSRGLAPVLAPALLLGLLTALLASCAKDKPDDSGAVASARMAQIRSRGRLICGINGQLPGFSALQANGVYTGLDVDICKAVAASVLGDGAKLELRPLSSNERFAALASGEVDLLSRNTTVALTRDAPGGNALSFAPIVYYDAGGVMVPASGGVRSLPDLAGRPICVVGGSTNESVMSDRMRQLGLAFQPLRFQDADQAFYAYQRGRCSAITSDRTGLAARRSLFADPRAHGLLPELLSKEPLAPVTAQVDPAWSDAVRWIVFALIRAEELGLSQANVPIRMRESRARTGSAELRRLLGVEGELGRQLGLPADFAARAVAAVGNYGELLERNVGPRSSLGLERGLNRLSVQGGLIQSPPFR